MKNYQVEGPDWLAFEHVDVVAKLPEGLPKDEERRAAAMRAIMQNMLLDRFKLRLHPEQKTFSVYAVVIGKSGIRFKEVPDCDSHRLNSNNTHFSGTCISMDSFAEFLSGQKELPSNRPVVDMTGLKGFYNLELDWIPESPEPAEKPARADPVFGQTPRFALEDQLGLKLESRKAPIEILMVDHAEKAPSEN